MRKTTHTRISTALPKDLLAKVDALVKASRYPSRSAFIEAALAQKLQEHPTVMIEPSPPAEGESSGGESEPNPVVATPREKEVKQTSTDPHQGREEGVF